MSIPLTIAGTTFNYPSSGQDPNWAEEASGWAVAVTDALNTLIGPGDILTTEFSIDNNISVATNINGLLFDSGFTRASNINYSVYRTSTANPAGNAETGTIYLIFDDSAPVNQKWKLSQNKDGDAGVSFSIGDNGQVQYLSSDIGSVGYSGVIVFNAKSLAK